jgi:hypothetical protein
LSIDGRAEIQAKLKADSSVSDLVGTYLDQPAIYSIPLAPSSYSGTAITMYLTSPVDGGLVLKSYRNTVNCWALSFNEAQALQEAVYQCLNRQSYGNDSSFKCSKTQIIEPQEISGDYNAPVEVLVRQR